MELPDTDELTKAADSTSIAVVCSAILRCNTPRSSSRCPTLHMEHISRLHTRMREATSLELWSSDPRATMAVSMELFRGRRGGGVILGWGLVEALLANLQYTTQGKVATLTHPMAIATESRVSAPSPPPPLSALPLPPSPPPSSPLLDKTDGAAEEEGQ